MEFFMRTLEYIFITEISRIGTFQISSPPAINTKVFSLNPRLLILSYSRKSTDYLSLTLKLTEPNSISPIKTIKINISYESINEKTERFRRTYNFTNPKGEYSELVLEFVHSTPNQYFRDESEIKDKIYDFRQKKDYPIQRRKTKLSFDKISIIGHRGYGMNKYTNKYFENTIPSFQAAIKQGADFVECDVQLTKDDVPVVIHNSTFFDKSIQEYDSDEFRQLGFFTPFNVSLSTFKELLLTLPKSASLDVEIKVHNDDTHYDRDHLTNRVLDDIYKFNFHRLFFCTFDPIVASMVALKQKTYNIFLLIHYPNSDLVKYFSPLFKYCGVKGFIVDSENVVSYPDESRQIISDGFMMMSWGNSNLEKDGIDKQIQMGLRGFITDDLDLTTDLIKGVRR